MFYDYFSYRLVWFVVDGEYFVYDVGYYSWVLVKQARVFYQRRDFAKMLYITYDVVLFQFTFVLRQIVGGEIRAFFGGDYRCGGSLSRCNG